MEENEEIEIKGIYTMALDNGFLKDLETSAKIKIRELLHETQLPIKHILEYSIKNKLFISHIDLLTKTDSYFDSVNLYSADTDFTARELIKQLCTKFGQKFILRSTEWNNQYIIEYNLIKICFIYSLNINKTTDITTLINPVMIDNLYIMPPIIELIKLYNHMYNPINMSEDDSSTWEPFLLDIKRLESLCTFGDLASADAKSPKVKNKKILEKINEVILNYLSDSNYVIIGDAAFQIENEKLPQTTTPIEFISKNTIDFDYKSISNFVKRFIEKSIVFSEDIILLPDEYNLKRYNFYILIDDIKHHILSIYNNATYELIPYNDYTFNMGKFKLADPIVMVMFLYLDIFEKRYVSKDILKSYKDRINIIDDKINWIGIYIDMNLNKRKINIKNPNSGKPLYYCYETIDL
jgi:hypothetical protein